MQKKILANFESYRFKDEIKTIERTATTGNELLDSLFISLPIKPQNDEDLKSLIKSKNLKPYFPQPHKEAEFEFNLSATSNTKKFEKAEALINQLNAITLNAQFELKNLKFVVSLELEERIREKHSMFLETPEQLEFYKKTQKLASLLNEITADGKKNIFRTSAHSVNLDLNLFKTNHDEFPKFIADPLKVLYAHRKI